MVRAASRADSVHRVAELPRRETTDAEDPLAAATSRDAPGNGRASPGSREDRRIDDLRKQGEDGRDHVPARPSGGAPRRMSRDDHCELADTDGTGAEYASSSALPPQGVVVVHPGDHLVGEPGAQIPLVVLSHVLGLQSDGSSSASSASPPCAPRAGRARRRRGARRESTGRASLAHFDEPPQMPVRGAQVIISSANPSAMGEVRLAGRGGS